MTDDELLTRAILAKCWIAHCSNRSVRFNETKISPSKARKLLRESGVEI